MAMAAPSPFFERGNGFPVECQPVFVNSQTLIRQYRGEESFWDYRTVMVVSTFVRILGFLKKFPGFRIEGKKSAL